MHGFKSLLNALEDRHLKSRDRAYLKGARDMKARIQRELKLRGVSNALHVVDTTDVLSYDDNIKYWKDLG